MLAGCGVDWFPESTTNSAAPDGFSFPAKTAQPLSTVIQSDSVSITGSNPSGWTVSVSDVTTGATSKYSISGGAFVSTPGTIKPNERLVIQQTTASTLGTIATTNVTVGTFSTTFQSTTTTTTP
jgi:hypothetical protein